MRYVNGTKKLRYPNVIYRITNEVNKKVYIGLTNNVEKRYQQHCAMYDENKALYKAMKKYGKHNFTFEVVAETKHYEDLGLLEKQHIRMHNSHFYTQWGYNMNFGGLTSAKNVLNFEQDTREEIVKLYQEKELTCKEIGEKFDCGENLVNRILKDQDVILRDANCKNYKKVINLDTLEIYESVKEAVQKTGAQTISKVCNGLRRTAGGQRFAFYDDYLNNTIPDYVKESARQKKILHKAVRCTTTGEIFFSLADAARYANLKSSNNISKCCRGEKNFAGRQQYTGIALTWEYADEVMAA